MIIWGRNSRTWPLLDVLPLKRAKNRQGKAIIRPITWHRDWEGWSVGRMQENAVDELLKDLEVLHEA